jgi:hypothetical protein
MTFDAAKRNLRKALDSKDAKEIDAAMKELDKAKDEEVEEAEKKAKEEAKDKKKSKDADGEEEWTPEKISARFEAHDAKFKAHDSAMEGLEGRIKACEEATTHDEESKEEEKKTEDAMEEEAPEGTGDKARKSKDSAYLEESVQATISGCEIIAPGLHYPTFDSATPRRKTLDTICALRRRALGVFASTMDGAGTVAALRGGKVLTQDGLTKMTCDDVRTIFRGAVAAKGRSNSEPERISATRTHDAKPTLTLADLNKRNRALFPDNK